jgi:hypothetical protein
VKTAVPKAEIAWDGKYTSSHGTKWWDGVTRNRPQTLINPAVPVGRDVGTVDPLGLPSRPTLLLGRDDGTVVNEIAWRPASFSFDCLKAELS